MNNKRSFFQILIFIGLLTIIGLLILVNFDTLSIRFSNLFHENSSLSITSTTNPGENKKNELIITPSAIPASEEIDQNQEIDLGNTDVLSASDYYILLSTLDGNYYHLFTFNPQSSILSKLTDGNWNDISAEFSPDGSKIIFSSNRNGYWNIYLLELDNLNIRQLTDNYDFTGNPTWSPDGLWIAYESNSTGNMDIFIVSTDENNQETIQLTNDDHDNFSPEWSPDGRSIIYVTSYESDSEIWKVSLDNTTERLTNLSNDPDNINQHPEWSSDGKFVSWSTMEEDQFTLYKEEISIGKISLIGSGKQHTWDEKSKMIFSEIAMPNYYLLVAYNSENGLLQIPPVHLPGKIFGMDYTSNPATLQLLSESTSDNPYLSPSLWTSNYSSESIPGNRSSVVELLDVEAPFAYLHDAADESYYSLRYQVAFETGWDFLSSLENAYLPLTEPPSPNMQINWLYTGRAIEINPASLYADWMVVVKENYFGKVFWRIYLRARFQDGSQGMPILENVWDFNSRYSGDPRIYETGGSLAQVPDGYWIDFTDIALRYGWERVPAMSNWRTYFDGSLFNQFVFTEGLDWDSAMQEIYPPELLNTATSLPTRVLSLSPTPEFTISPTSTPAPTITLTPTFHPTWTPVP